jgi:hypothetical protein
MVAVAVLAVSFGLVDHIRRVIQDEAGFAQEDGDFSLAILFFEGVLLACLLGSALVVRLIIRFVRRDDVYASQLRRDDPVDFDAISRTLAASDAEILTSHHP